MQAPPCASCLSAFDNRLLYAAKTKKQKRSAVVTNLHHAPALSPLDRPVARVPSHHLFRLVQKVNDKSPLWSAPRLMPSQEQREREKTFLERFTLENRIVTHPRIFQVFTAAKRPSTSPAGGRYRRSGFSGVIHRHFSPFGTCTHAQSAKTGIERGCGRQGKTDTLGGRRQRGSWSLLHRSANWVCMIKGVLMKNITEYCWGTFCSTPRIKG